MAQIPYRANLSATVFPMTIAKAGRTVIDGRLDQHYDRRIDPEGSTRDVGIPQLLYCENVAPTPNGFQSVGFLPRGTVLVPPGHIIDGIFHFRVPIANASTFAFSELDEGDKLATDWTFSPLQIGGGLYSQVVQSATIGDPAPSYELREDETRDPGEQPFLFR